jgi:hypothetical protein
MGIDNIITDLLLPLFMRSLELKQGALLFLWAQVNRGYFIEIGQSGRSTTAVKLQNYVI